MKNIVRKCQIDKVRNKEVLDGLSRNELYRETLLRERYKNVIHISTHKMAEDRSAVRTVTEGQ